MPTPTESPASSGATSSPFTTLSLPAPAPPSFYESLSRSRSAVLSLAPLLPAALSPLLSSLSDSDRPAISLLSSPAAYSALSASLSVGGAGGGAAGLSGSGSDPICHWLYDTCLSPDPDLRLIPLSFLPVLSSLYFSRLPVSQSPLSGFEAVILAIYSSEVKSRAGKPVLISVPDLSLPSLYHSPPKPAAPAGGNPRSPAGGRSPALNPRETRGGPGLAPSVSVMSAPLEPQVAVKSTKRAAILAACFDAYYAKIALLPACSKVDLCNTVANWAGQNCPCRFDQDTQNAPHNSDPNLSCSPASSARSSLDPKTLADFDEQEQEAEIISSQIANLEIEESNGSETGHKRVPLPWELLQPLMRILGHCLLAPMNGQEVRDAASVAVRCVYARASHELLPQAILSSRSLIQLDIAARSAAATSAAAASSAQGGSNGATPRKQRGDNELALAVSQ